MSNNFIEILAAIGYGAFVAVSAYLCWSGQHFEYYQEFATLTAGSGTLAALVNRYVNSKYNSAPGSMPQ